ncbi:translation elongation factor Ts [candidate division WWE3 bacterium RIFCSPHIGHO2_01_FULL_40_23]|uniref:Elongation factor Ts n=1 Tax=candidate division WWE3 bacterium RIFCSPLOWO2_01_FULL_41_18 TaxID=1802625 RepID=A0A1F4VE28_UNCKA|nr:MAG: translation elongation factor Ts [candidate division WWE3 bacterium RIFCSPHIGHO2_01_FULL_40_23]OGC55502.1 MAG: translation elongation factor Ts [candidate division WWE3 bacterium RIFCSPLOWO2_01_FULL_41_18]
MNASLDDIKKLREETGAGVMEAKKALEEFGSYEKAKEELSRLSSLKAEKKADRSAADGLVVSYIHSTGKVGSLVEVNCETDFVAKTDAFKDLCRELAMQAAAIPAKNVEEFLKQGYIRDDSKKISDLVNEVIAKTGENIKISRISRFKVGE